jgi:hypothetical protein
MADRSKFVNYAPVTWPHPDERPIRVRPAGKSAFEVMSDRATAAEARSAELADELSKARRTIKRLQAGKGPPPQPRKSVSAPADE